MNHVRLIPLFIFAVSLAGCSLRSVALRSTVDLIGKGTEAFYEEPDLQLAEESMASQLKLLEILMKNDPMNRDLLLFATQGFGAYSFLFLEENAPDRARAFYERGRDFGLKYLAKVTGADLLTSPNAEADDRALLRLKRNHVPILFWTAYCWGGYCNLSRNNPDAIAQLPKVEKMMLRVNELFPGYFYSNADVFLGAYYGSKPKMFGGDLDKAKFYFDRAMKVSDGKFLMGIVLYAKYYAVPAQDKEFCRVLLERVLEFPAQDFPEQRLSNEAAKKAAAKMMEDIDELF